MGTNRMGTRAWASTRRCGQNSLECKLALPSFLLMTHARVSPAGQLVNDLLRVFRLLKNVREWFIQGPGAYTV